LHYVRVLILGKKCVFSAGLNVSSLSIGSGNRQAESSRSSGRQQKTPDKRTYSDDVMERWAGSGWNSEDADCWRHPK